MVKQIFGRKSHILGMEKGIISVLKGEVQFNQTAKTYLTIKPLIKKIWKLVILIWFPDKNIYFKNVISGLSN